MADVSIEGVSKRFPGGVTAVDGIDICVPDACFTVLVGPSGCGKSTTLRMVAGLEEISRGTIRIAGRVVNNVAPKDRDIAMVFQNYALYPHMTIFKNMAFGLKLRKVRKPEIEQRVRQAARMLGIENLLDRKPRALSGGQRQRVAVGRAIVRDPACFLFDEPLSNLDARLRIETRAELKRLHQRLRTTTIYVTHDQEEAMTLGDQVVVMDRGRIQQCGAPLDIFHQPKNRFVAGFVGMPPMNFFDGKLFGNETAARFQGSGVSVPLAALQSRVPARADGRASVLGIRPDSLRLRVGTLETSSMAAMDVDVTVVEPLGSIMDLYCVTRSGHSLVARVEAEPISPPAGVKLYINPARVLLFAPGPYGEKLLG